LPLYDDVKYIHVARDGRDVVMSMHNHYRSLSEARRERLSKNGAEDPVVGRPFPPIPQRPDEFFRLWLTRDDSRPHHVFRPQNRGVVGP
jgi:aryl sulfotransferase